MSTTHRGNQSNEITFEEHDGVNNAKRVNVVQGSFSVNSTATVTLMPSPSFIGIVTIANPGAAAAGNITLDPGSRTGIVGNITLSDPKGFIGLVTIVGSLSAAAGNITLDPGSRTGLVGNVTLSDAKTFIGLTTTTLGAGTAAIGKLAANSGVDIGDVDVTSLPNGLLDSFGHIITAEINNDVDVQFYRATSDANLSNIITETEANGGTATKSDGMATFATTTAGSSRAKGVSLVPVVYTAGAEVYAIFTAAFPAATGGTGSYRRIGLYNDLTDGLFIGYETDGTFGISIVKGGSQVTTLKANFSTDTLVGGAGSKYTRNGTPEAIDLTKLNVFRIRLGWVGSAPIKFEVLSPDGNWVLFHTILQPNLATVPSLNTADLYFTCDVFTGTSGNAQSILTNCWGAGTTQKLRKLSDTLTGNTLAGLTRAVITGVTTGGGGTYVNVKVNPSGALSADVTGTVGVAGNVTLSDSKGFIGLVTVVQSSAARTITGNVTLDAGSKTQIAGNVTISDSKGFIGLATVNIGSSNTVILGSGVGNVGFATVFQASAARTITGNLTLSDPKGFIGLVTVVQSSVARTITGNVTISGTTNVAVLGNVTLSDPKTFIGLVTAVSRNAGTTKTLIPLNASFAQVSIATIAVPSATFNITSLILNANATVGIRIKSGVTYLLGNVSISTMLNPGGGFVQNGSPDSPVFKGLAAAAAIVLEKEDFGVVTEIAGHLIYFDE